MRSGVGFESGQILGGWGGVESGGEVRESSWEPERGELGWEQGCPGPSRGGGAWPLSAGTPVMGSRALDPLARYLYSVSAGPGPVGKSIVFCLFSLGTGSEGGWRRRPELGLQPEGCRVDQRGN